MVIQWICRVIDCVLKWNGEQSRSDIKTSREREVYEARHELRIEEKNSLCEGLEFD